jgi:hypothetical protein
MENGYNAHMHGLPNLPDAVGKPFLKAIEIAVKPDPSSAMPFCHFSALDGTRGKAPVYFSITKFGCQGRKENSKEPAQTMLKCLIIRFRFQMSICASYVRRTVSC